MMVVDPFESRPLQIGDARQDVGRPGPIGRLRCPLVGLFASRARLRKMTFVRTCGLTKEFMEFILGPIAPPPGRTGLPDAITQEPRERSPVTSQDRPVMYRRSLLGFLIATLFVLIGTAHAQHADS